MMLSFAKVNEVVHQAASSVASSGAEIASVESEPMVDPEGHEALSITILLKRGTSDRMGDNSALDTLVSVANALRNANEDRFPVITYVTEEELDDQSDDPES